MPFDLLQKLERVNRRTEFQLDYLPGYRAVVERESIVRPLSDGPPMAPDTTDAEQQVG